METISVLTLAGRRARHFQRMVEALSRSRMLPSELLVVRLDDSFIDLDDTAFPIRVLTLPEDGLRTSSLRLAEARNLAAAHASADKLLFLDVDCMPSADTLEAITVALDSRDAIVSPEVLYLATPVADNWVEAELCKQGVSHPVRDFPSAGMRLEENAGLLWSLAFGITAKRFREIGGFDGQYYGYGAEDTDLGFLAMDCGIPLVFLSGAPVFHQCHDLYDPPLQHFDDILRNARRFMDKWGVWPMEGWLAAFAACGFISWHPRRPTIELIRTPTPAEIASARRPAGTPF